MRYAIVAWRWRVHLVKQHGGGGRDVETVGGAAHRQADVRHASGTPRVGQAVGFAAEHDGGVAAVIGLRVIGFRVEPRGEDAAASLAQPGERFGAVAWQTLKLKIVPRLGRMQLGL